jgi:hypothetical protein
VHGIPEGNRLAAAPMNRSARSGKQWLSTQSFEEQREFGLKILELAHG